MEKTDWKSCQLCGGEIVDFNYNILRQNNHYHNGVLCENGHSSEHKYSMEELKQQGHFKADKYGGYKIHSPCCYDNNNCQKDDTR